MEKQTAVMVRHLFDELVAKPTVRSWIAFWLLGLGHDEDEVDEHMLAWDQLCNDIANHTLEAGQTYHDGFQAGMRNGLSSAASAIQEALLTIKDQIPPRE